MGRIAERLAVQSWCFRAFKTNAQVIEQLGKIGLKHIELCGVHADFNKPETFEKVIGEYRAAGVRIVSIGVQGFGDNPIAEESWFKFAKMAGAGQISATFDRGKTPEAFASASKLADTYGINLAIHNHGRHDWLGSPWMLEEVFKKTSPRIGLCLDTAWMLDGGHEPLEMAERFIDRLYGVHIKDFVFDRAGKPEDVVVGTGNLDLAKLVHLLESKGKPNLCAILEYEGDEQNPAPALKQCVEAVRAI